MKDVVYDRAARGFIFAKRAIIVFTVFLGIIALFSHFAKTDRVKIDVRETGFEAQIDEMFENTSDDPYTQALVASQKSSLCYMIGEGCSNTKSSDENFNASFFGSFVNPVAQAYANPPASGIAWIQNSLQDAGLIPNTYAAEGFGFASMHGYISIWKAFRNIAYLILVLVMVSIGFMIMFQMKVNPQTTIAVQNALPKIVVAMLLITFSFPIAGFLIDFMYVVMSLGISIIFDVGQIAVNSGIGNATTQDIFNNPFQDVLNKYINSGMDDLWPSARLGSLWQVSHAFTELIPITLRSGLHTITGIATLWLAQQVATVFIKPASDTVTGEGGNVEGQFLGIGGGIGAQIGGIIGGPIGIIGGLFIFVVGMFFVPIILIVIALFLTALFAMFKLFFSLLTSYLLIILYILFSPLILMFEAIPGRGAFSWWLRNLLAELMVFPLVTVVLLMGKLIILYNADQEYFTLPFLYNFDTHSLGFLISFGIVLMIPNLIQMMKQLLGAKGIGSGVGVGMFFSGISGLLGGAGAVAGIGGQFTQLKQLAVGHNPMEKTGGLFGKRDEQGNLVPRGPFGHIFTAVKGLVSR